VTWKGVIIGVLTFCAANSTTVLAQNADISDYFPLNLGDWHSYGLAWPCPPETVRDSIYPFSWESFVRDTTTIGNNTYYIVEGQSFFAPDTLRVEQSGTVFWVNTGIEKTFLKLNAAVGDTWSFTFNNRAGLEFVYVGLMQSRTDSICVPAGTFNNCLRVYLDCPTSIDEEITYFLAPNVGKAFTCAGVSTRLHQANVNGTIYPKSTSVRRTDMAQLHRSAPLESYPNPFNASTTLRYEMANALHVILKVYNILGQEVATLVDEAQEPGYKSVEWDAGSVSSGVYLCRLQAGNLVQTRKLVLMH
jgi:hypothetical protein